MRSAIVQRRGDTTVRNDVLLQTPAITVAYHYISYDRVPCDYVSYDYVSCNYVLYDYVFSYDYTQA